MGTTTTRMMNSHHVTIQKMSNEWGTGKGRDNRGSRGSRCDTSQAPWYVFFLLLIFYLLNIYLHLELLWWQQTATTTTTHHCYVKFLPEHSPMFSDVLHSHVTLFHPFCPTHPFRILTPSSFHSLSAAFPHQHHIHHINHRCNMPGLSWNHLGIFQAVMERHQKHHGYT